MLIDTCPEFVRHSVALCDIPQATVFSIGSCTGQIIVANPVLNTLVKNVYVLSVQVLVDDDPGSAYIGTVTVTITAVNTPPVFMNGPYMVCSYRAFRIGNSGMFYVSLVVERQRVELSWYTSGCACNSL